MTSHIVCLDGPADQYAPPSVSGDTVLIVPFDHPSHPDAPRNRAAEVLGSYGLSLSPAAEDLLRAAIGAYTGDVRVSRTNAYDGWTRDLMLHLPVCSGDGWNTGSQHLERLLAFLTGDRWQIVVRPSLRPSRSTSGASRQPVSLTTDTVCLFSGGLDSFVGALDALATAPQVALVGHHALGQGPTSAAQHRAYASLQTVYPAERVPFLQCWISPPKGPRRASESTTRGRSILFLALGVAVASGLNRGRLLVPENGLISLNVPLTPPRSGSLSTRTTHPHLVDLFRNFLADVGIDVRVELPYRFKTKGEMLRDCADQSSLEDGILATMSCAHPGVSRFTRGGSSNQHCGYCFPCLIRRAAIGVRGADPTVYTWDNLRLPMSPTRGADLRALRLALERYSRCEPTLAHLLTAGPLPGTTEDRSSFLQMFRRGIVELERFVERQVA